MEMTSDVSIVFPLRVDSLERADNLTFIIDLLLSQTSVSIDVLEADTQQHYRANNATGRLRYRFVYDEDPIFHRTRYLNQLLADAEHSIVGVWDTDVIILKQQLLNAVKKIRQGSVMCFPYDGRFLFLNLECSRMVRNGTLGLEKLELSQPRMRPSVGGAFLVNKDMYIRAGGENERFYGWGPEDAERIKRMEILGLPISRVEGPLFHLHHPRGINSGFDGGKRDQQNLKALLETCCMTKEELEQKINSRFFTV